MGQNNNPASASTPAGFLIRKHSTVLLCEEVRPGTSQPGLHFYCSMIPLRTQSGKKESPAALYDRAAGARWGICLSENNHRKENTPAEQFHCTMILLSAQAEENHEKEIFFCTRSGYSGRGDLCTLLFPFPAGLFH